MLRWLSLWMVFQDPPNHTRLRATCPPSSTRAWSSRCGPRSRRLTAELLDDLPKDEPVDFFTRFGLTLPGYVVMDLLGVPRDRLPEVKQWSDEMMLFIGSSRGVDDKYGRARHGARSMAELFRELIDQRRTHPRDDVLTRMISTELDGETLTEDELTRQHDDVGNGAQETTAHLLSNGLIALQEHPDAAKALSADLDSLITPGRRGVPALRLPRVVDRTPAGRRHRARWSAAALGRSDLRDAGSGEPRPSDL